MPTARAPRRSVAGSTAGFNAPTSHTTETSSLLLSGCSSLTVRPDDDYATHPSATNPFSRALHIKNPSSTKCAASIQSAARLATVLIARACQFTARGRITSLLLMMVPRICDDGSDRLGLRRNQQSDEISGIIPALPLGDARLSQHAAANGAHAMSKLEGAPCRYPAKPREGLRQRCGPH